MDKIIIKHLEVFFRVGVPDEERAQAQRLLLTVEMEHGFAKAATTDDLRETVDYYAVAQRLLEFGENREWRLIEKLACDAAQMILEEFRCAKVTVAVKKFIIPQAEFVAVEVTRTRDF